MTEHYLIVEQNQRGNIFHFTNLRIFGREKNNIKINNEERVFEI